MQNDRFEEDYIEKGHKDLDKVRLEAEAEWRECVNRFQLSDYIYRLDGYQAEAVKLDTFYDRELALQYHTLALAGEAGELANKVKKEWARGRRKPNSLVFSHGMVGELGDILWYVAAIAGVLGLSLGEIANRNIEKLRSREARGVLIGDGDAR